MVNSSVRIKRNLRNRVFSALSICLCAALLSCASSVHAAPPENPLLNRPAPSIVSQDLNGNLVNLDNYQGQVVVLNFWGSWCVPCQLEMPRFAAWQKKYGPQGLQLLGVSMDDNPSVARKVSIDLKLDYPVIMGDVRLGTLYGGILGLPVTYLIGRDGQIRARFQGDAKLKDIEAKIVELLAQH